MSRGAVIAGVVMLGATWAAGSGGCKSYRVEYHHRPSYYRSATGGELPDRVELDDGTVLVFTSRQPGAGGDAQRSPKVKGEIEPERFQIRKEQDDGTVVLRALLPQQVLANTLTCLRNEEYELIWEQLVSEQTKRAYEARGQGEEEFCRFFAANRVELAATLTRMLMGLMRQEAFMQNVGGGVIRFRFHPRVSSQFKFKTAEVVAEGGDLRLKMIR